MAWSKDRTTVQSVPFQRSARDLPKSLVKAQTLVAEVAAALTTVSPVRPGKGTCVQALGFEPFRSHAVGLAAVSKAQPPFLPTATTALKPSSERPGTRLTTCQDGLPETGTEIIMCLPTLRSPA